MKKKQRKSVRKQLAGGVVALIALGFSFGLQADAAEKLPRKLPNVQYEMVPHVVLPETVQYDPVAKNTRSMQSGSDVAGSYGTASPFVGSYTAFPSYNLPHGTEMKTVGQSVYPVTAPQPLPLPKAKAEETEEDLSEQLGMNPEGTDLPESDRDVAPILLASGQEEVVPATPLSLWDNAIQQTGLFCQKPAKAPSAWSFTSPIFKAASVPMGWGSPNHGGYITQTGPRGCMTQVGFNPNGGGMPGMGQGGMMQPPMQTFQAGQPGMPQVYNLPNGMMLLSMPSDHSRCGIFRCRCGNNPRMMLLPGAPGGMPMQQPGMMPGMPGPEAGMGQPGMGMMPQMHPMQAMSMQLQPVMGMTPYGMSIVGYRQVPVMQAPMQGAMPGMMPNMANVAMNPMTGNMVVMGTGMMSAEDARLLMQMQQGQTGEVAAKAGTEEAGEEHGEGLKVPLSIHSHPMMGQFANPYAMYANQAQPGANNGETQNAQPQATPMMMPPAFMQPGMAQPCMMGSPMPNMGGYEFSGMYMTPYGMMTVNPGMQMNGYGMGYGMMPPDMMNAGMGGQFDMNRSVTMSDLMQLMVMMNNQKPEPRRFRLFQRLAERRQARQAKHAQHDPFQELMAYWSTPYGPADTAMRMPSRNAYPYGYFGAQVAPQNSANYGGYYNLYMGNTTYPGTSGLY